MTERKHPAYHIPEDPHGKRRHESAMRHVEHAKKEGKSSEEIHALYRRIMDFDPMDIDSIPNDDAHKKYRSAAVHMKKALENGKSPEEAHEIFHRVLNGETQGHAHS